MRRRAFACVSLVALSIGVAARAEEPSRPPHAATDASIRGMASWYGMAFQGKPTASGEPFDPNALTAAHRTLPFGTVVEVRSLVNGRKVRVRINDRGPHSTNRLIDLSEAAARELGLRRRGTKLVEVRVVDEAGK